VKAGVASENFLPQSSDTETIAGGLFGALPHDGAKFVQNLLRCTVASPSRRISPFISVLYAEINIQGVLLFAFGQPKSARENNLDVRQIIRSQI
jgi:hypothetical protein